MNAEWIVGSRSSYQLRLCSALFQVSCACQSLQGYLGTAGSKDLQQHRPTSILNLNPLAGFHRASPPTTQGLTVFLWATDDNHNIGFPQCRLSVQHNCSGTTQASDLRGPEDTHNHWQESQVYISVTGLPFTRPPLCTIQVD